MTTTARKPKTVIKLGAVYFDPAKARASKPWARRASKLVGGKMVASRIWYFPKETEAKAFKKPKPEDV